MEAKIGVEQNSLTEVSHLLGTLLADEYVLYTKTRKAHWCVVGPDFYNMHKFFENHYDELAEIIDAVAERIRTLGHFPPATLGEFLELTHLSEESRERNTSKGFIKELLSDHESILKEMRGDIDTMQDKLHDAGTSDFITGILEQHEKMAWMLRSHLE